MIDYATLCDAIERFRAGGRPSALSGGTTGPIHLRSPRTEAIEDVASGALEVADADLPDVDVASDEAEIPDLDAE